MAQIKNKSLLYIFTVLQQNIYGSKHNKKRASKQVNFFLHISEFIV